MPHLSDVPRRSSIRSVEHRGPFSTSLFPENKRILEGIRDDSEMSSRVCTRRVRVYVALASSDGIEFEYVCACATKSDPQFEMDRFIYVGLEDDAQLLSILRLTFRTNRTLK